MVQNLPELGTDSLILLKSGAPKKAGKSTTLTVSPRIQAPVQRSLNCGQMNQAGREGEAVKVFALDSTAQSVGSTTAKR
jgi:hypothetical protein